MLPDRVSNPGPLTYESGALPIALRDPAYVNLYIFVGKWLKSLQNSGDPDQMPHYVASDLGLHFLPIPL